MYVTGTRVPDCPSSLHIRCRLSYVRAFIVIKIWFLNCLIQMKVQKAGFQDQEDGTLLEGGGNASVRYWYTRTRLPKFVTYSMPSKQRSCVHRHQSPLFELP
ncbi:hypothetical protein NV377_23550 [Paenibacillus sp. T3-5-0-4]|nr:hypothetical protein [Paenibacillus endoradicis]